MIDEKGKSAQRRLNISRTTGWNRLKIGVDNGYDT